ncbi:MAG: tyrosine--tRNA ligase [Planctomycetaceae bacterium]|nr:tyrosine--tRNA ligase [Planctomycetaceae bacterium]
MQDIVKELQWRGAIHQKTDENIGTWLNGKRRTVYIGFDPTADSLHVGHLVQMMTLRRFQQAGHRPIALVGGATGMIGDPSGKSEERNLLTVDDIRRNAEGMRNQMTRFLDFDTHDGALLINNYDWLGKFSFLDFLRDVGKHFPVNVMMAKDSVKSRLAQSDAGMSYTEFSYQLLQSYDFYWLHKTCNCEMQVGGSDQWGNITAGIDFVRRMGGPQLYGLTSPLLTKSDGKKMGKTESGSLWLDAGRTSPYVFYQYWVNLDDADVDKALKFFTEMSQEETQAVLDEHFQSPEKRVAQKRLADDLTRLIHGEEGLQAARRATDIFFGAEIADLADAQLLAVFADVKSRELPRTVLNDGLSIIDALVESGLAPSKSEARRTLQGGGAYVNNRKITGIDTKLTTKHLAGETVMILRSGKKNYALLRFV